MVSAAEIAAYNSSLALACDELAGVRRLDATPFARGFSKAAWRGEWHGRELVLKLPAAPDDAPGLRAFFGALKQELKFAIRLGRHPQLLEYYGSCHSRMGPDLALAVEGPLIAWAAVVRLVAF